MRECAAAWSVLAIAKGRLGANVLALVCLLTGCGDDALHFSPSKLPDGKLGESYAAMITVSENDTPVGDVTVEGSLPPGLTLTSGKWTDPPGQPDRPGPAQALVAGTPSEAGTFPFTIHAHCVGTNTQGQTGSVKYSITVR
jgi:Putative Ig domain